MISGRSSSDDEYEAGTNSEYRIRNEADGQGDFSLLPEEIVDKILVRLPVLSLMKARQVCKRWSNRIPSHCFFEVRALCAPAEKWMIFSFLHMEGIRRSTMYNVWLDEWHKLPLRAVVPQKNFNYATVHRPSVRGLLCATAIVGGALAVGVCNPLTKVFRQLPRPPVDRWDAAVSIVEDHDRKSYKVVITNRYNTRSNGGAMVYEPFTDSWKNLSDFPVTGQALYPIHRLSNPDGVLFFSTSNPEGCIVSGELYSLNVHKGSWQKLVTPRWDSLPQNLPWMSSLLERRGSLLLVLGVRNRDCDCCGIQVWNLELGTRVWRPIAMMPESMFLQFYPCQNFMRHPGLLSYRLHMGEIQPFCCFEQEDDIILLSCVSQRAILHHLAPTPDQEQWRWLADHPFEVLSDSGSPLESPSLLQGISFQPRLDVRP